MGLDMYLEGHKRLWDYITNPTKSRKEDGLCVSEIRVQLGYWRKHPNLHGYIVETFADGKDECQEIGLDAEAVRMIMRAIRERRLPPTTGFFFGRSGDDDEQMISDLAIFERALAWLEEQPKQPELERVQGGGFTMITVTAETKLANESRVIVYRASW